MTTYGPQYQYPKYLVINSRGKSPGKTFCANYGVEVTNQKVKKKENIISAIFLWQKGKNEKQ